MQSHPAGRQRHTPSNDKFLVQHDHALKCWRVVAPASALWATVSRHRYHHLLDALRVARACRNGRMLWLVTDHIDDHPDPRDTPPIRRCLCDGTHSVPTGVPGIYHRLQDADEAALDAMRNEPTGLIVFRVQAIELIDCSGQGHPHR